ncbi:IclR family transcriptional regulator, partial [Nocardia farcinica]|nr:IclR family transcriptional regulator [Nocardia farcinica]
MSVEMVSHPESGGAGAGRAAPPVSMIERMTAILDAFDADTPTVTLLG